MPSFDRPAVTVHEPSAWVERFAGLILGAGRVLDLACGDGRHARLLARLGHPVTAVDIDVTGLGDLEGKPGIDVIQADLEKDEWPFAPASFAGNERFGRPRNPDFLLAPGELLSAFAATLQVVAYEHGIEPLPRPAVRQRLVALRASGSPSHDPAVQGYALSRI